MSAATQPLLIPDDKPAEDQQPTSLEGTVVADACRLVDAARLPTSCYPRDTCYRQALTRLAAAVDRMRDIQGDPRDGMPASRDDALMHFVAPGEIVETVDSTYFATLLDVYVSSERFVGHLDMIGAADLPVYDDHTTVALTQLQDALAGAQARQRRLQTLRNEFAEAEDMG